MTDRKLIELRDGVRILTREGYREAIRLYLGEALDEAHRDLLLDGRSAAFEEALLARFDAAAPKYGPLDLDGRDWSVESLEEDVDGIAYRVIRRVRDRGL